ncbi:MAG TPA: cation diffusion facilitator family transporter [Acidimicrobiales bacterium]|nr:cation diffusion facilitator family transporter [Acidimicrobiales bacterium]
MTEPHQDHDHDHSHGHGHGHDHHHHGGLRGVLEGLFRPHSHDPADSVDDAVASSREGMRTLKVSLGGLAATAVVQLAILVLSGSVALLADTIHNFADALTAGPLAVAFWIGRRPPDRRYTYGYGRAEDLAGVFVVLVVAASAVVAAYEAVGRLLHPTPVDHLPWVAVAGLVGFAGNEIVARYRLRTGRRIGSAALEADGYHARTDGFTSLAVVASAIGLAAGWRTADAVFSLLITVSILVVVRSSARDIYRRLMDAVDPDLVARAESVLAGTPGVQRVETVRLRWVGHALHAETDLAADTTLTLGAAHDIAEHARHRLLHQVRRLDSVTVHMNPCGHDGTDPHAVTAHHAQAPALTGQTPTDQRSEP